MLSSLPEKNYALSLFILTLPCPIHLHSLMPMTYILYLFISLASWADFPIEYNVLTFQHPIFTLTFGLVNDVVSSERPFGFDPEASYCPNH